MSAAPGSAPALVIPDPVEQKAKTGIGRFHLDPCFNVTLALPACAHN